MILQHIQEGGIIAWNHSQRNNNLFASGSILQNFEDYNAELHQPSQEEDGAQNSNFDYFLTIHSLDVLDKSQNSLVLGRTRVSVPFRSIAWSTFGEEGEYPFGIICGGMADGSICLFDVNAIISYTQHSEPGSEPGAEIGMIFQDTSSYENCGVYTVEVNPFKPHLFALGGNDVLIMDIEENITNPQIFAPAEENPHEGSMISAVSWNKKVSHILASASRNGLTTVWDLKSNQSIFNFQENSGVYEGNVNLDWNPEMPTQIAVTYDDQKNPEVQIWDLRQPQGPVILLEQGHALGISALTWCNIDPTLILSGGLDKKLVSWNYKTGEIITELEIDEIPYGLRWSSIPSVFSYTGSENSKTFIYSIDSEVLSNYAPRWIKPPVGTRFSPAGICELVKFSEQEGSIIEFTRINNHLLAKGLDNKEINELLKSLEDLITNKDLTAATEHRISKHAGSGLNATNQENPELEYWSILNSLSTRPNDLNSINLQNPKDRSVAVVAAILKSLGFDSSVIVKKAENYTGKTHKKEKQEEKSSATNNQTDQKQAALSKTFSNIDKPEDWFDNLAKAQTKENQTIKDQQPAAVNTKNNKLNTAHQIRQSETESFIEERVSRNINWNAGIEGIIKENLIVGNIEGAIDCAIGCGRSAEALLLAWSQGKDIFESTMHSLFTSYTDNYLKTVIRPFVECQLDKIVDNYELQNWRECAGMILSKVTSFNDFQDYMETLAARFQSEQKDDENSYLACLLLAQDFETTAEYFYNKVVQLQPSSAARQIAALKALEQLIAFRRIVGRTQKNSYFKQLIFQVSQIALTLNEITAAFCVLGEDDTQDIHIALLRERLYVSNIHLFKEHNDIGQPAFPLKVINVASANNAQDQKKQGASNNNNPANNLNNNNKNDPKVNTNNRNNGNSNNTNNINSPTRDPRPVFKEQVTPTPGPAPTPFLTGTDTSNSSPGVKEQAQIGAGGPVATGPGRYPLPPSNIVNSNPTVVNNSNKGIFNQTTQVPPPVNTFAPPPPPPVSTNRLIEKNNPVAPPPVNKFNGPPIFNNVNNQPPITSNNNNFAPPVNNNNFAGPPRTGGATNSIVSNPPPPPIGGKLNPPFNNNIQPVGVAPPPAVPLRSTIIAPTPQPVVHYEPSKEVVERISSTINTYSVLIDQLEKNHSRREEHKNGLKSLFTLIDNASVAEPAINGLVQICQYLEEENQQEALKQYTNIINVDYDQNKVWMIPLKRLIVRR